MIRNRDWRPSCELRMLRIRAAILRTLRSLFSESGYLEVETPCLSREVVLDDWIEPFEFSVGAERWFLQTSPEAFMKRLLAAGSGSIFQVSRVFRRGESGQRHNPEFTMLEWYGSGTDWRDQVQWTERLVRRACESVAGECPGAVRFADEAFGLLTYGDAFRSTFGVDVHGAGVAELMSVARGAGVPLPDFPDRPEKDDVLNAMLAFAIEPGLGVADSEGLLRPVFLCDYPSSQAALAVVSDADPPVARRFELYVRGVELCNGYQELTDAEEILRRENGRKAARSADGSAGLPGAPGLIAAMNAGLPECSGVALGFDRLVMIAAGMDSIRDVLPFPQELA